MDIDQLREKIDQIDDQMLSLFEQRMAVAKQIGSYKKAHSLPVNNPLREQEIILRFRKKSPELAEQTESFFSALFEISKRYQEM
ncbi:MAG: chorismate mutase [Oscillospiraceae bacterium]|nr:chorismate mutase [Oscillospiraceae bacterium]